MAVQRSARHALAIAALAALIFGTAGAMAASLPERVTFTSADGKTTLVLNQERAAMDRDFVLNVKAPQAQRNFLLTGKDGSGVAAMASFQPADDPALPGSDQYPSCGQPAVLALQSLRKPASGRAHSPTIGRAETGCHF